MREKVMKFLSKNTEIKIMSAFIIAILLIMNRGIILGGNTTTNSSTEENIKNVLNDTNTGDAERDMPDATFFRRVQLNVNPIPQTSVLPTGSEVISLITILNYYGYSVDELTLAKKYLPKGNAGEVSPYEAFVGDPRSRDGYGAYAPVLVDTANKYLQDQETLLEAKDVTGITMDDVREYLRNGFPVMIWLTSDMQEPRDSVSWNIDGDSYTWKENEYCVTIIGFADNTYMIADPSNGIVELNSDIVESVFTDMGQQAVVIQ